MRLLRLRLRTALLGVAVLATGMGLGRSMYGRLTYCRGRAEDHDAMANTMESQARWARLAAGNFGVARLWEEARRSDEIASEHRELAARFRAAAWRPWRRLPTEPDGGFVPDVVILRCPDDDTIVGVGPN